MPELQKSIMMKLHNCDIWKDTNITLREPSKPQGWHGDHPSLSRLAKSPCIVDVGVWKGDSTITMARALKESNIDGCVIAVDTFLGSPEHYTNPNFRDLFSRINGRPDLYETFLSNVLHADVQDYIVPLPQTSITASEILKFCNIVPNVVHIDAAHEYLDVIRDAETYFEILSPGGFLIGDDYNYGWPGIIKAAGEFSARHSLPLTIEVPKWIVQKNQ